MKAKTRPNDWTWVTKTKLTYKVHEMARSHVHNSLQWCIRNRPTDPLHTKDGHTYDEWIMAFTVRLLDPECE